MVSAGNHPQVLVVNQHGDNRGDEAAMYGMVQGITQHSPDTQFTIIHQFRDDSSVRAMLPQVPLITLKLPVVEAARLVLYLIFRVFRLRLTFLLGRIGKATIAAYENADIVVSAPGGPYFGDLYINHEFVHWLYVWMAALHKKPVVLYAPSAGPFNAKWANPFRRFTYRCCEVIYVREEISASNIRSLFGSRNKNVTVHVSADAALQVRIPPAPRSSQRQLIAVSAINWTYKGTADVAARQKEYDSCIAEAVSQLAGDEPTDVVLIPQLHSTVKRDAPYLAHVGALIEKHTAGKDISVRVLDESTEMLEQRATFASADWVIAGRYHPAVFALSAGVPQLCIPYEHKATGLLQLGGLDDIVLPIEKVNAQSISEKVEYLKTHREDIRARSEAASEKLCELSGRTSLAVVNVLRANNS